MKKICDWLDSLPPKDHPADMLFREFKEDSGVILDHDSEDAQKILNK